jgi:hypothetical protein
MHPKIEGNPDILLKGTNTVVFLHGCFWHKCPNCYIPPKSNRAYWLPKIEANVKRFKKVRRNLRKKGYNVAVLWEHQVKSGFFRKAVEAYLGEPLGQVRDIDITGLIKKKSGAPLGDAHELFVRSILMRLGFEVGKVDLSSGPYDLILAAYVEPGKEKKFLRAQIKTVVGSLSLIAGSRGGIDREYKSGVKTYKYSEKDTDLILGVDRADLDIYVFPVRFAPKYGDSVGKGKIEICKNNWDILLNWNDRYLSEIEKQLVA